MLFETFLPNSFCREYVEVKGNSAQLAMFMAVVLGIKPLMDDWILVTKLQEFKKVCKKYGLKVREDTIFVNTIKEKIPNDIIGKECLTTTVAYGYPLGTKVDGQVHLFISKEKKFLNQGMWYPVIIKNRVIFQPRIDSLRYGYVLGYPDCCIRFFRKYNNWVKYSHLYEAYINTKEKPSFFCNPFLKDTSFSYIYHMPCSYSCKETIKLVIKLREEIKKREPEYVKLTDMYLKKPFLIFYERKYYYFDGTLMGNKIKYKNVYFVSPEIQKDAYGVYLREANTLRLEGRMIILLKNNEVLNKIDAKLDGFAPEFPFLIQFR